ncbi:hypothetical protein Q5M85_01320 [Paraclostridium bifermentans]|nr:hypothetical protein [Paraclostridium bifermentans]
MKNDNLVEQMVKERIAESLELDDENEAEIEGNEAIAALSKEEYIYGENVNAPVEKNK